MFGDELLATRESVTTAHGKNYGTLQRGREDCGGETKAKPTVPNFVPTGDSHEVLWVAIMLIATGYVSAPYGTS
jgi:hypothetical protein